MMAVVVLLVPVMLGIYTSPAWSRVPSLWMDDEW